MLSTRFSAVGAVASRVTFCVLLAGSMWGQQAKASLFGTVVDESGAVIPGAAVTVLQGQQVVWQSQADAAGNFVLSGIAGGEYSVRVKADGFQDAATDVKAPNSGSVLQVTVTMKVSTVTQQVTVTSEQSSGVGLESTANANAVVLQGPDLEALPDDPEDMKQDLEALAGPAIGSSGAQTYVDGFSSSHLPPKDTIREVRINQDPFSAQYDHVGFGRIEVLTKPGTGDIHGMAQFKMSDALFNSRNPYAPMKPFYRAQDFTGDVGGPLGKRASFFLNFDGRWATDNEVVSASVLGPSFNMMALTQAVLMPDNELSVGGRIDYKLSEKHSLTARYQRDESQLANAGVGGFLLPSSAYAFTGNVRTLQVTENAVFSNTAINQTRFQYVQADIGHHATGTGPSIQVMDAFTSGAAVMGNAYSSSALMEIQNYTTKILSTHTLTFGGQIRRDAVYDSSPANFAGTFVFSGGLAPELNALNRVVLGPNGSPVMVPLSSLQRYQRNMTLQQAGFSSVDIAGLGGGASQFSIAAGHPASSVTQTDLGLFVQDNWRVSPSLSLDLGLRWEGQNDIHDWRDLAPRLGLAWMPGGKNSKTVIRAGAGIFYDRFPVQQVLLTGRFNGHTQQQFVINNPSFYPQVPSIAVLQGMGLPQTVRTLSPGLRSPYLAQVSGGIEREMPLGILASLTYIKTIGQNLLVSQNVTAPGGSVPCSIVGPHDINYQYTSAGVLNDNQFVASVRRPMRNGIMFYARYEYNRVFSNTDGVSSFPANQYNLQADYGRAATDIRHTFVLGGSLYGPFGTLLSPFVVVRSGAPFNITTGHDNNGDTVFTDRPSFAVAGQPNAMITPFGIFNPYPAAGAAVIPRNYGQGESFAMLNLRVSRTFGIGARDGGGKPGAANSGSMFSKLFTAPATKSRYNFTVGLTVRNVLNTTNSGLPVGNLSSPFFGRPNWPASAAGPSDVAFGNNRRLQFQLRFDF